MPARPIRATRTSRETTSSRSGIREVEKIEYKIYKLTIDNKIEFLFEDLNLAENKKDYIQALYRSQD